MLLTITTTRPPATDLGYLLHKHPAKVQSFDLSFGQAQVFYSEAGEQRCTAVLILDIDPVALVRQRRWPGSSHFALQQYVNDRPYVASSFLSVAISQVYGTALHGKSKERQHLADLPLPFQAKIAVLPCRGGEQFLRRLFEPLGYHVTAQQHSLDLRFPEWGDSSYFTVELTNTVRLCDLLGHLYVLIPVLDDDKHYWVGADEVAKLLRHGKSWLKDHPEVEIITSRYLKHRRSLTRSALLLLSDEDHSDPDAVATRHDDEETTRELPLKLHQQRMNAIMAALKECHATRVIDLGCGEGKLLQLLIQDQQFTEIVGVDVAYRSLEIATSRLRLDRMPDRLRARIKLIQGSLIYRDDRIAGYDAATIIEVIEHLDPPRLAAFERVVFEFARPGIVIITTPNREYNVKWPGLARSKFRHRDHRFEWSRAEFNHWAEDITRRFGYHCRYLPVGVEDPAVGAPTHMGVFRRD